MQIVRSLTAHMLYLRKKFNCTETALEHDWKTVSKYRIGIYCNFLDGVVF